ncbi:hypothetical protein L1987_52191 [Smallanthus sonchifolius]|uniref:Uncharacterized protein n=1 Tax=Smallanthus sonchifolius TaxID=185202 RepID=A0ACB9ERV4_9ASTR|nr:hypothetical protein L1987_52191 [Smallanthus sonchifolius]
MEMLHEPSIDTDKLSYEIFSILESKFLFGYDDPMLWKPKQVSSQVTPAPVTVADDTSPQLMKNQRGKICVLSIDGGGMRSILAGKALDYLENALKAKSGNQDARIADYFDVAAGTGVGGVFTAMLFGSRNDKRPIFKAEDTWRFMAENGKRFYQQKSSSDFKRILRCKYGVSYKTAGFENAMKEAFTVNGTSLTLKNTLKPVLIPCYDLSSSAPFLFSRADALETDSFDFRLWEVLEGSYDYNQVKGWKAQDWARPMARISGDSSADMVDHAVSLAFGQSRSSNYVRIQANGSCGVNIDSDCSPGNIKMLMGIAEEMLKQKNVESVLFGGKRIGEQTNFEKLDWFAGELVLEHQRRSCRIAPTVAFKQPTTKPI